MKYLNIQTLWKTPLSAPSEGNILFSLTGLLNEIENMLSAYILVEYK